VDLDKAKGGGGGLQDRVERVVAHANVRLEQAGHEVLEILGLRANKFGKGVAEVIPFTQEHTVRAQTGTHKARAVNGGGAT
jgi:hypothetical protein